jgi:hypothetical protein
VVLQAPLKPVDEVNKVDIQRAQPSTELDDISRVIPASTLLTVAWPRPSKLATSR